MNVKIKIVGLGPGSVRDISIGTIERLKNSKCIVLRTENHPTIKYLKENGIEFSSLDWVYNEYNDLEKVFERIAKEVISKARETGEIVYAVPGHPLIAEKSVESIINLCKEPDVDVDIEIIPAMSFIDSIISCMKIDCTQGLKIIDGLQIDSHCCDRKVGNIITQVYNPVVATQIKLDLMEYYRDETMIWVIRAAGVEELEKIAHIPLYELDRQPWIDQLTSVYIPPVKLEQLSGGQVERLLYIIATLRAENGCPWDREQNHKSLRQNLIEEAYEVIDAIDRESMMDLEEELGDVLLQVVFHAQIAKEGGQFSINDVIKGICDKLIFRHPHIFSNEKADTAEEVLTNWEKIKKVEKGMLTQTEVLKAIPISLPALMRAFKVQKKAADVGFDWDEVEEAMEKVKEEWIELREVYSGSNHERIIEELGDLLFSIVNVARFLKVQPELALGQTIEKFINRFSFIEENSIKSGKNMENMTLEEMDELWNQAKNHIFKKNDKNY